MELEEYLIKCLDNGIIDHCIRANKNGDRIEFYIHPEKKDGDTLDFYVNRNNLSKIDNTIIDIDKEASGQSVTWVPLTNEDIGYYLSCINGDILFRKEIEQSIQSLKILEKRKMHLLKYYHEG